MERLKFLLSFFFRYFHTLRYLKPLQIYRRIWFCIVKPKLDESPAPPIRKSLEMLRPLARRRPSLLNAYTFKFLNQSGALDVLGWERFDETDLRSKLWRYNQHYFDDLNADNAADRKIWHLALLQRWVAENVQSSGLGWDPYPTSLRIVNWVKWQSEGNVLPEVCVQSLAVQTRWLTQRIEWHILGNHLFANAKALIFAGLFFCGKEADRWLSQGLSIIVAELPEQVLLDGANFELSPMYHVVFLEDLLDLINLAQAFPGVIPCADIESWREFAQRMLRWLDGMTHPDGEVAFFNDAVIGSAPNPAEVFAYASRLGLKFDRVVTKITHFADSGYIRLASSEVLLLIDVAQVGPDYLPGHAHADTLSFELSLFGKRVFVNGGTSEYVAGHIRQVERGTASHNTVVVNGENSSEVWAGFRVARRAYPFDLVIEENPDSVFISCAHDGYSRLKCMPIHRRTWEFSDSRLVISDQIVGDFECAVAYFHVHPDMKISVDASGGWVLVMEGQKISVSVEVGDPKWSSSYFAPEFGCRLRTQCLEVALGSEGARVCIEWSSIE